MPQRITITIVIKRKYPFQKTIQASSKIKFAHKSIVFYLPESQNINQHSDKQIKNYTLVSLLPAH
jgi:hypothetical protein